MDSVVTKDKIKWPQILCSQLPDYTSKLTSSIVVYEPDPKLSLTEKMMKFFD